MATILVGDGRSDDSFVVAIRDALAASSVKRLGPRDGDPSSASAIFVPYSLRVEADRAWREHVAWLAGATLRKPLWLFVSSEAAWQGEFVCRGINHLVVADPSAPATAGFLQQVIASYDDSEVGGQVLLGAGTGAALTRDRVSGATLGAIAALILGDKGRLRPSGQPFTCPQCRATYALYLVARPAALRCFACSFRSIPGNFRLSQVVAGPGGSRPSEPRRSPRGTEAPRQPRPASGLQGQTVESGGVEVALSFASEQRTYVDEVATHLQEAGISIFYDQFEETALWGKDLAVHLAEVYRKARFVVVFVSKEYASKPWTQHEFQNALAQAVLKRTESILPVRFDETELSGLRPTVHYLDARRLSPPELAQRILQKLGRAPTEPVESATCLRLPAVPPANFNQYAEAERTVVHVREGLARRARRLEPQGFAVHATTRGERFMLRVMRTGRVVYGLDVWIGGGFGDNTICFAIGTHIRADSNSTNGTAMVEWDRDRGVPVVKMFNMSILREMGREYRLTAEELADEIWEALCEQLERGV